MARISESRIMWRGIGELNGPSEKRPEIMNKLIKLWEGRYAETGMINYPFEFVVAFA